MSRTRLPTSQMGATFHTRRGRRYQIPGPAGGVGQQKRSGGAGGAGGPARRWQTAFCIGTGHLSRRVRGTWDRPPSAQLHFKSFVTKLETPTELNGHDTGLVTESRHANAFACIVRRAESDTQPRSVRPCSSTRELDP